MSAMIGHQIPMHIHGSVGLAVNAGVFNLTQFAERMIAARGLGPDSVREMCATYVPVTTWRTATGYLNHSRTVALVGDRSSGRRITAVNLARHLQLTPFERFLDLDEKLAMEPGNAYLVDLDGMVDPDGSAATNPAKLREFVNDHKERVPAQSVLLLRMEQSLWTALEIWDEVPHVKIEPVRASTELFGRHLRLMFPLQHTGWENHPKIASILSDAHPRDVVRLATTIKHLHPNTPSPTDAEIEQVLSAYLDWEDTIAAQVDGAEGEDGVRLRAIMLAIAALEGAPVTEVFGAAQHLLQEVKLTPFSSDGLSGPGIRQILKRLDVEYTNGTVRYRRSGYANAVLNFVWLDRPQLQEALQKWLISLARPQHPQPADAIAHLAMRQGLAGLLTSAARTWATDPNKRPLAVDLLTAGALSDELGRNIRDLLLRWANKGSRDQQKTLAEVCGGIFGRAQPQLALTRVRKLAEHTDPAAREAALVALSDLAAGGHAMRILETILDWMEQEHNSTLATTARAAFIRLWRTFVTSAETSADQESWLGPLTRAWARALDASDYHGQPCQAAAEWLDEASRRRLELDLPVAILSEVRRQTSNPGLFPTIYFLWGQLGERHPEGTDRRHALLKALDTQAIPSAISRTPWMATVGFLLPNSPSLIEQPACLE
ncbi:hypothetical protein ACFYTC_32655 [Actinomadura nitritigenes]|uniref:hypothetical protein n=1 Tax=Actinomadura nitritigenes TaxID=134602 RepID=UPI0036A5451E